MTTSRLAIFGFAFVTACAAHVDAPAPTSASTVAGSTVAAPSDSPAPSSSSEPKAPDPSRVKGRLEPALIQKIVRAEFGVFRKCYEAGLARNANLGGRVATKFVIERDGTVSAAQQDNQPIPASAGPDYVPLPDPEVIACIVARFKTLRFPEPEGGIVTVVYPIVFHPGD